MDDIDNALDELDKDGFCKKVVNDINSDDFIENQYLDDSIFVKQISQEDIDNAECVSD